MANRIEMRVPDMGNAKDVTVIEILVKAGDTVAVNDSVITLEGDKASMEVPATDAGVVETIKVKIGDKVSKGDVILILQAEAGKSQNQAVEKTTIEKAPEKISEKKEEKKIEVTEVAEVHAGPGVRRMARELGVDLNNMAGSGLKGRILKEDVESYVGNTTATEFGAVEKQPLNKIKRATAVNLQRNWATIPHVTQFDEADITEMEAFRQAQKKLAEARGVKLTPIVFIMKAVVAGLKKFPTFNASLDTNGENLILKKYFHLGIAVDTPNGLVVPVIRDVDQKSLFDLAEELASISKKAREKGLSLTEMMGSCFTISSLGGIGGTAFTPIINAPDVAILGVSKAQMKPVYQDNAFVPRLMLPLSLSYDHRAIDGADGARFTSYLVECLSDIRRLLL